jgi:hypothetical protein
LFSVGELLAPIEEEFSAFQVDLHRIAAQQAQEAKGIRSATGPQ